MRISFLYPSDNVLNHTDAEAYAYVEGFEKITLRPFEYRVMEL